MNLSPDAGFNSEGSRECESSMDTVGSRLHASDTHMLSYGEAPGYAGQYDLLEREMCNTYNLNLDEFGQYGDEELYLMNEQAHFNDLLNTVENDMTPLIANELDLAELSDEICNRSEFDPSLGRLGVQNRKSRLLHAQGRYRPRRSTARTRNVKGLHHGIFYNKEPRSTSGKYNEYLEWIERQEMETRLNEGITKLLMARQILEEENGRFRMHLRQGNPNRDNVGDLNLDRFSIGINAQKVFLGGLPCWIVESSLIQKLAEQGYTVINKPRVLRGFCPEVCLSTIEEAQCLIRRGKIMIDGWQVDVRQYQPLDHLKKKLSDDIKRSVFLGGLSSGTTGQMIKNELKKYGVRVINHPVIKAGFTPQVMLADIAQAEKLVRFGKIRIYGALVDVRPYVVTREHLMYSTRKESVVKF